MSKCLKLLTEHRIERYNGRFVEQTDIGFEHSKNFTLEKPYKLKGSRKAEIRGKRNKDENVQAKA